MNSNNKEKKKIVQLVIFFITFTVLLVYLVNHAGVISGLLSTMVSLIMPFLLGCAIAFIINIPMRNIEATLFNKEDSVFYKHKRTISMLLSYLAALLVIVLVCFVVIPEVKDTLVDIYKKLPGAFEEGKKLLIRYTEKYPEVKEYITNVTIDWDKLEKTVTSFFTTHGGNLLSTTISIFSSVISVITNIFIALVFSLYILSSKEDMGRKVKMFIYAMFKEKTADEMMVLGRIAHNTFSKFFASQFREGIILGTMFFICMSIFRMPYALTIGVCIAFTALIPVFGAFVGLFIGSLLLLVEAPKLVIWFVVMFFVLQFIENNFIYPKLVGGDVGLSAIWVLLAVLVGGDLMGVVGMFVFIPFVSVIYSYGRTIIYRRLKAKNIDISTKVVAEDAVPLMESRRRMFQRRPRTNAMNAVENVENNEENPEENPAEEKLQENETDAK